MNSNTGIDWATADLVSVGDIADRHGVSPYTVYRWVKQDAFPTPSIWAQHRVNNPWKRSRRYPLWLAYRVANWHEHVKPVVERQRRSAGGKAGWERRKDACRVEEVEVPAIPFVESPALAEMIEEFGNLLNRMYSAQQR